MRPVITLFIIDMKRMLLRFRNISMGKIVGWILGFAIFCSICFGIWGAGRILSGEEPPIEVDAYQLMGAGYTYLFLIVFVFSLNMYTGLMSRDGDLSLLKATPLKDSQIVGARLLTITTYNSLFLLPMFISFIAGFSPGKTGAFPLLATLSFLLTLLSSVILGCVCAQSLLGSFSAQRFKRLQRTLSLLAISLLIISLRFVLARPKLTGFLPFYYGGPLSFMKMSGLLLVAWTLVVVPSGLYYLTVSLPRLVKGGSSTKESSGKDLKMESGISFLSPQTNAVMSKEFKSTLREPEALIRMFFIIGLLASMPLITGIDLGQKGSLYFIPMVIVEISWAIGMILNTNAIGIEGKQIHFLRATPLGAWTYLKAKWLLSAVAALLLSGITWVFLSRLYDISTGQLAYIVLFWLLAGTILPAIGLALGCIFPDFKRATRNRPGLKAFAIFSCLAFISVFPAGIAISLNDWGLRSLPLDPWIFRWSMLVLSWILGFSITLTAMKVAANSFKWKEFPEIF